MGAADFMDQMTVSSRSADAVLRNYPINMTNRDSTNERQRDHGGLRFLSVEATSNLWEKCSSERMKLRRMPCSSPAPPSVLCPRVPLLPLEVINIFADLHFWSYGICVVGLNYLSFLGH